MEATAVQKVKGRVGTGPDSLAEVAEKYKAMLAANTALDRFEEDAEQRVSEWKRILARCKQI